MYPFSRLMFLSRLTFLNTCGGLKLSGRVMWDERGAVEFAAQIVAKTPTQIVMRFSDLISRHASVKLFKMVKSRFKERKRKLLDSNEDLPRVLRLEEWPLDLWESLAPQGCRFRHPCKFTLLMYVHDTESYMGLSYPLVVLRQNFRMQGISHMVCRS